MWLNFLERDATLVQTQHMATFSTPVGDALYGCFHASDSTPLKPRSFRARALKPHDSPRVRLKPRQAAALAASCAANGIDPVAGAKVPRRMVACGEELIIEYGCGQDLIKRGIAGLIGATDPWDEVLVLTQEGAAFIQSAFTASQWVAAKTLLASEPRA